MQLQSKDDHEIIGIQPATSSYIDENYFRSKFKEKQDDEDDPNSNYLTFAVKVQCVRADWIINDEVNGIAFLKEMIRLKNKDIFMTNYTKIITQYLYK